MKQVFWALFQVSFPLFKFYTKQKEYPPTQKLFLNQKANFPKRAPFEFLFNEEHTKCPTTNGSFPKKTRSTNSDSHDINMCGSSLWQSCIASFINYCKKLNKKE